MVENHQSGLPAFKGALMQELRNILRDASRLSADQTKIVDMRFVFSNKDMLLLLKKRAKALRKSNLNKVHKYESKIDTLKRKKFDDLRTPNKFFCTFESA